MTKRTPKELLKELRKVLEAQKKRNPAIIVKQGLEPEQADSFNVRCVEQTEADGADRHK